MQEQVPRSAGVYSPKIMPTATTESNSQVYKYPGKMHSNVFTAAAFRQPAALQRHYIQEGVAEGFVRLSNGQQVNQATYDKWLAQGKIVEE